MMLYNKWRPAVLNDIQGQPHITRTLLRQLKTGRLAHAYLFTGSRGTGKTTCAKILARAVNCQRAAGADDGGGTWDGEPCNQCPSCLGILNGSVPDVSEIDAASNSGVDNIRSLRDELIYTPTSSNKRVYIIDEVHMLSIGAFNALLKTLEEPPGHVLFILATTETHKVPATIVSRCQRFAFRRIASDVILDRLGHICGTEGIEIEAGALELISQVADGSLRDALSLLEQCCGHGPLRMSGTASGGGKSKRPPSAITEASVRESLGLTGLGQLSQWLREMDDLKKSIGHMDTLYQSGMDVAAIMGQLSSLLRDLLMGQMLGDLSVTRLPAEDAETLTKLWPKERILQALSHFTEIRLSRSGNKKLDAELCLIRLASPKESGDSAAPAPPEVIQAPPAQSAVPPPPEPLRKPEPPPEKPEPSPPDDMIPAERDPRWADLLKSIDNPLLKDALSGCGAKVSGDSLFVENDDPFIQGVINQANIQIKALFPGGVCGEKRKPAENKALDALIETAGDLIIEE